MGFDIECIVDIHSYPGEYFCPVCRTLVYPNEALQSQCTHLYCKPCLAHVANNTRACPYDGYLVTEADSKALLESDKVLAENVGKVKVRCLFHRSGCTWEGTLSESTAHCAGCAFGNSPVICNRCGIQIVHREVHDHAQTCPGVYQAQQAAVQDAATSSTATTATTATTAGDQNQVVAQPAPATSQAQNPQATATHLLPGQDPNQQATVNSQAPAVAPAAAPTPEQWYQQYYQQYAGYEAYQQSYQQYYPYQQQVAQQYQQQAQGQYHPQGYAQLQPQAQAQAQAQPQPQPQVQVQPQPHHLSQPQSQPQPSVQSQSLAQTQVPVQGQPQPQSHVQAMTPQYQNLTQVNPQQQFPPTLQPHAQGNPIPQPQPYTHPPPHPMQSQSQQYVQMPQYQQPHLQMHPPHVSQSNIQPNRQSQPQPSSQPQPQPQLQPQPHLQNYPQSYPQSHPPQINQPIVSIAQPQSSHIATPAVTGHHSYQPPQQTPVGAPSQHSVHPHPMTGSLPIHGQISQQLPLMRPPPSHGPISNQQQSLVPSHGQGPITPPAHQQQFYPHAPPPGPPVQQRPGVQSIQQPVVQQSQNFPGPTQGPYGHYGQQQPMQSQFRPQGAPQGAAHAIQPGSHGYSLSMVAPSIQPQQSQNYSGRPLMPTHGAQPQSFPQAPGGYGAAAHNNPVHHASNQPFAMQNYGNRTSVAPEISHKTAPAQGGTPTQDSSEKDIKVDVADTIDLKAANPETGMKDEQGTTEESRDRSELSETLVKDADREAQNDESGEPVKQQTVKAEPTEGSFNPPVGKSLGTSSVEDKDATSFASKDLPKLTDMPTGMDNDSQVAHASASSAAGSDKKDAQSAFVGKDESQHYGIDASSQHLGHSSHQQNSLMSQSKPPLGLPPPPPPRPQAPGYPPTSLRPQGPEHLHPGQPLNPMEHSQPPLLKQSSDDSFGGFPGSGSTASYGLPSRSFAQHAAPQRPPFPGVPPDPRNGIMGRPPQHGPEGPFGVQESINAMEADILQNQRLNQSDGNQLNSHMPGTLERGPYGQNSGIDPNNSRIHGAAGLDSSGFGLRDERFNPRALEHGNRFPMEPMRPFDQAPRPLHGPYYDGGSKSVPGASGPPSRFMAPPHHAAAGMNPEFAAERELPAGVHEDYRGMMDPGRARPDFLKPDSAFGRHHMDHSTPRSPDREYFGMPPRGPRSFGEGPRSFNLPLDPVGNPFPENRFPAPGHHNGHLRRSNPFEQDTLPGHLRRSEMLGPQSFPGQYHLGETAGFDAFPGRGRIEELGRSFPHHMPAGESFRGNHSNLSRFGEPGFRSSYSLPGFPKEGLYAGDLDPFDKSRKRKPVCMGWCRICKVDCESVEGLDMHSQTREHQRMAMDMVKSIKQQNRKKLKLSGDHAVVEEANKARSAGFEGRGNKA